MKTLVFVGSNIGHDVTRAVDSHDACWLFEPIPEVAQALQEQFYGEAYRDKAITVVNAACWSESGTKDFNLYNTNGLSSSLGEITPEAVEHYSPKYDLSLIATIKVRTVNLADYMPAWVDTLVIDAQGADLTILKTIQWWLQNGRIGSMNVECDHEFQNYSGMPGNSFEEQKLYLDQFPQYKIDFQPESV